MRRSCEGTQSHRVDKHPGQVPITKRAAGIFVPLTFTVAKPASPSFTCWRRIGSATVDTSLALLGFSFGNTFAPLSYGAGAMGGAASANRHQ